jgi:hypothetical protein
MLQFQSLGARAPVDPSIKNVGSANMKPLGLLLLTAALCGLLTGPAHAAEDEPSAGAMAVDLVVARPLGIVATTVGAAAFLVSLPFSLAGGNVDQAADKLVMGPARETFVRCLGCRAAGRYQEPR